MQTGTENQGTHSKKTGNEAVKSLLHQIIWVVPMLAILYAVLNPQQGILWQSPMTVLGVGLIGLGMLKHGLDKQKVTAKAHSNDRQG